MAQAPEIKQPWSFDPAIKWRKVNSDAFDSMLNDIWHGVDASQLPEDASLYVAELPFYRKHKLYCLLGSINNEVRHCFMLHGETTVALNGTSPPIVHTNNIDPVHISIKNVACYIRFFCSFVHADLGSFLPIERADQIDVPAYLSGPQTEIAHQCKKHLLAMVTPISVDEKYSEKSEEISNVTSIHVNHNMLVNYGDDVFQCKMRVLQNGTVQMLSDEPVLVDIPEGMIAKAAFPYTINALLVDRTKTHQRARPSDKEISRAYIEVLTRHALQNSENWDYVTEFNNSAIAEDVLLEFADYVFKHDPVVLIESEIPFIEELVADVVIQKVGNDDFTSPVITRVDRNSRESIFEESPAVMLFNPSDFAGGIPSLLNIERISFELSRSRNAAFIGTDQRSNLQDAICNIVEFELIIPRLSPTIFRQAFKKILGGNLPRNWKKSSLQWIGYLTPQDFHQPCKLGLTGIKAYQYLHKRVKERLNKIDVKDSPALADMHGMAEAKQIAEDLILDIQAALKGKIPWSGVDRGMLLSGPPGTGKTTLARAIAKSCGIRFIAVSAATWQSTGYLDAHLRAMRASFAEARRYAPTILFIDEMDSFSDRESQAGNAGSYHTEVVNALLAEIQGFDTQKPVFVIGATNFPDKVDPALRRAGRLDKLVYIPRPNMEALSAIYLYYLNNKALIGQRDRKIDIKLLAGLSFGLTGADVETFVRGAARRARKEQATLNQQHLIDEITGKSRQVNLSNRLTPEEMHQIAVHESGHALMQLVNGIQEIAFISIVPRENGSLGFVSSMPFSFKSFTRKQYLAHLQVILAGRAAEEIVFGNENISGGAGGESANCDLAIATRIATDIVSKMGMGKTANLLWNCKCDEELEQEIEKLLQEAYSKALTKLEAYRQVLDDLTNALLAKQELTGHEVAKIAKL